MRNYFLLLYFFFLSTVLLGQSPEKIWEKRYGTSAWNDAAHDLIENFEGQLVFVGTTKSKYKKGEEAYFVIVDKEGNSQIEKQLGRRGDEQANSIVQTPDGGYIFVGSSNSKAKGHQGKKDGWIVKLDETGEFLWDTLLGSKEDDILFDVVLDTEGRIFTTGQKNKNSWVVALTPNGTFLWEKVLTEANESTGKALAINAQNELLITGFQTKKSSFTGLFYKMKEQEVLKQQKWEDLKGMDIQLLADGNLVIGGIHTAQRTDMALLKINADGEVLQRENYGGRGHDGAFGITRGWHQNNYLVGFSFSHIRAARREKLWVNALDAMGQKIWAEDQYFGGEFRDKGYAGFQLSTGQLILVGTTHSKNISSTDAWLIKLKGDTIPKLSSAPDLEVENLGFTNLSTNDTIRANNRGYFSLRIKNKSQQPAYQIMIKSTTKTLQEGIKVLDTINLGYLAGGQEKIVFLPIVAGEKVATGNNTATYQIEEANSTDQKSIELSVSSEKAAEPKLVLITTQFVGENEGIIAINQPIKLSVTIENKGKAIAENVTVKFSFPYKVNALSEKLLKLGDLLPNTSSELAFSFQADEVYLDQKIEISCRVREATNKFGLTNTYTVNLEEGERASKVVALH